MLPAPRTDPDLRHYRIRLLPRVFGVEPQVRVFMQDLRTRNQKLHTRAEEFPSQAMPLAEVGGFPFPMPAGDAKEVEMTAADLQLVLQGIDPQKVKRSKRYQRPAPE